MFKNLSSAVSYIYILPLIVLTKIIVLPLKYSGIMFLNIGKFILFIYTNIDSYLDSIIDESY
jgi:hypothetical protein